MVMVKGLIMMFALLVLTIYGDQVDKACQEREKRKVCPGPNVYKLKREFLVVNVFCISLHRNLQ